MAKAKVFMNGNSQAIRLPKEFAFKTREVNIKRIGRCVVLFNEERDPWKEWKACLGTFSPDFMSGRRDQGVLKERARL